MADASKGVVVNVSVAGVEQAASQIDRLTAAIERASAALQDLKGKDHGGIEIKIVGDIAHVVISPPPVECYEAQ